MSLTVFKIDRIRLDITFFNTLSNHFKKEDISDMQRDFPISWTIFLIKSDEDGIVV
jgi:hypothetical protein